MTDSSCFICGQTHGHPDKKELEIRELEQRVIEIAKEFVKHLNSHSIANIKAHSVLHKKIKDALSALEEKRKETR